MIIARIALVAICLALAGCPDRTADTPRHAFSWWRGDDLTSMKRIAVLPFTHGPKVGRTGGTIAPAFAAALRELGTVQVVEVDPAAEGLPASDPVQFDLIAAADLLHLRDRYHVDAVLIGRIDRLTSFDPIAMDLSLHLVSCHDGQPVWSGEGSFDGQRADVQADIASWHRTRQVQEGGRVLDWHSTLQSPSRFARYVADRMTATVVATETRTSTRAQSRSEAKAKPAATTVTRAEPAAPIKAEPVVKAATTAPLAAPTTPRTHMTHTRYGRD